MSVFDKIVNFFSTGVLKEVDAIVDKYVITGEDKERMKREMTELLHRQELEQQKAVLEAEQEFNTRIKEMEGTANDLKQSGWLGRIVLFLRGAQRPLWGYFVAFMDFMVYSGQWNIKGDDQLQSAFWIINFLVLGFLFGERAVKNVAPLVKEMLTKRKSGAEN